MRRFLWILFFVPLLLAMQYLQTAYAQPEEGKNWPKPAEWERLKEDVQGRLIQVESPIEKCADEDKEAMCARIVEELQSPFDVQKQPWATLSTGWLNAWSTTVSPYAVAAQNTDDIVAAVNFAREHKLKLVIKGAGHDYLGRSCAPNSLLVWTYPMRGISMHDSFIPAGAPNGTKGIPAMTAEAGTLWLEAYIEVTTKNGRYVQGGGCTSVGVAGGFLQGGGFGSCSKKYGTGGANLLEAEVVIASGEVLIANAYQNADLFWALKGGGGGTFGVVSKVTLQTHDLPNYFGLLAGKIKASTDESYKELIEYFINFYRENLFNDHWGEQVLLNPENTFELMLFSQGLDKEQIEEIWKPFRSWISNRPELYTMDLDLTVFPASEFWDYDYLKKNKPEFVKNYLTKSGDLYYYSSTQHEVFAYWYTYESRWIPRALFEKDASKDFAETLFRVSRYYALGLHFNKGLAGGSTEAIKRVQDTPMNPVVLDSPVLLVFGAETRNVFPGVPGLEPNFEKGFKELQEVNAAIKIIVDATPGSGSYSNEADYFEPNWQKFFWGKHYPRLLEIKQKYDPNGFFTCHHSVGSEIKRK